MDDFFGGPDMPDKVAIVPPPAEADSATAIAVQRRREAMRRGRESLIIDPSLNRTTTGDDNGLVIK